MNRFKMDLKRGRLLVLGLCLAISATSFAGRFGGVGGGGFHPNGGYDGYHHDDYQYNDGIGNYHPGNGYVAPVVILDPNSDCNTVQQCDSDGNCSETQECN